MSIIDKYFTRQITTIFVILLLILTGLAWMMQIMSMMKFLMNYGVEFGGFLWLTALMIPFIISIIIPFVTFIAIIFVYNKMISENEITVMCASGLSPRGLARPAINIAMIITFLHLFLNLWLVPVSQSQFYSTQWNLRYGLAHMKLQENAFTEITSGLVVYVDKVAGHDMSQVMLSDMRDEKNKITVFAEKGKLVSTVRGLSIVMTNGSLQIQGKNLTTGTFDAFDMDLNVADKNESASFRVRRVPTFDLLKIAFNAETPKQQKMILSELCTRFLSPIMNLILSIVCCAVLLRTSLLRRRASFAPALAVSIMAGLMALFMSVSNMLTSFSDFVILAVIQLCVLILVWIGLGKK